MKYSKRQITEAIAYWKSQLKRMTESADSVSIEIDCTLEKPYVGGKYQGEYNEYEFKAYVDRLAKQNGVRATVTIPGVSSADATVNATGPEYGVRKLVCDLYAINGDMTDEEWNDIIDMGGTSGGF